MSATQNEQSSMASFEPAQQEQTAVPYVPPPPPQSTPQKRFNSFYMNGAIIAVVILLGGFMTFNFVGKQLTQTAGLSESTEDQLTPTMTPFPTDTLE